MFDTIIQFALRFRLLIIAVAVLALIYGFETLKQLPIDVFPDLNRPTVTIITEVNGLAPEEVETLVSYPIEAAMNGAAGVVRVRSTSSIGFSLVTVEFAWDSDIYLARQRVTEKLGQVRASLPEQAHSQLGPVSSIMGEVLFVGLSSTDGSSTPMQLRNLAEWNLKQRLLGVAGVSKITVMGGELQQYHILIDPLKLQSHEVSIHQVKEALANASVNTTGGFVIDAYREYSIRNLGRVQTLSDLKNTVIAKQVEPNLPALTLADVAEVKISGPVAPRGDASINGRPGVILAISKQPNIDTIALTKRLEQSLDEVQKTLPKDIELNTQIFRQADFINQAINNISEALRDGALLVALILFLFLLNWRTTAITLIAIPLSFVVTFIMFKWMNLSINTMTLGGLAIAIGELVDDAIVDVENVFRRLKENKLKAQPKPSLQIVFEASKEIRNSIVFASFIVVLVFIPLLTMEGIEGKIFVPLGLAYITAISASLLVSLSLTPVLCSLLLPSSRDLNHKRDALLVRGLKRLHLKALNSLLNRSAIAIGFVFILFCSSLLLIPSFGKEFLPSFNEGSLTINVSLPPGTSLEESKRMGLLAEKLVAETPEVSNIGRRIGRAEEDEHALGVNTNELEVSLRPSERDHQTVVHEIRTALSSIPGVAVNIGQPISHRIDFISSGINAQIAIKIFGDELTSLRQIAEQVKAEAQGIKGLVDVQIEQQLQIPQVHIRFDRDKAKQHGVMIGEAAQHAQLAMQGETVTRIIKDNRLYDVVLRLNDAARQDAQSLGNIPFDTQRGNTVPLSLFADIEAAKGPNVINRENVKRRIVVQANVQDRDLVSAVEELKSNLQQKLKLEPGYYLDYDGQFKTQARAQTKLTLLAGLAILGVFLALYLRFSSVNLALQVLLALPFSLMGAIVGIYLSGATFSVASLIGLVTLIGIASRNGIMLLSHYLHLLEHEGESFNLDMLRRGTQERLVPVLMTASTALLALSPLLLAAGESGKEILHPVAVVIFSGLISSTLLNLLITPLIFWRWGKTAKISSD